MESRRSLPGLSQQEHYLLRRIQYLEAEKIELTQQVRGLEEETAMYRSEINTLSADLRLLEAKTQAEQPAVAVGLHVRHRFLEKHRQRMGKPLDSIGHERIKRGDRAAHRGRALVDSWICETASLDEKEVFEDLYGVPPEKMKKWANIPELIEVVGLRASLKSEDALFEEFEGLFNALLGVEEMYRDARQLERAFDRIPVLALCVQELQKMYVDYEAAGALAGNRKSWRGKS